MDQNSEELYISRIPVELILVRHPDFEWKQTNWCKLKSVLCFAKKNYQRYFLYPTKNVILVFSDRLAVAWKDSRTLICLPHLAVFQASKLTNPTCLICRLSGVAGTCIAQGRCWKRLIRSVFNYLQYQASKQRIYSSSVHQWLDARMQLTRAGGS
jgi:hypothetical protein